MLQQFVLDSTAVPRLVVAFWFCGYRIRVLKGANRTANISDPWTHTLIRLCFLSGRPLVQSIFSGCKTRRTDGIAKSQPLVLILDISVELSACQMDRSLACLFRILTAAAHMNMSEERVLLSSPHHVEVRPTTISA